MKHWMSLKLIFALFLCVCCINVNAIDAIENNKIRYADIAIQLIEAETVDDAKHILDQYNLLDQAALCNYILEQQRRWCIEHDLFDYVSLTCNSRELLKCLCAVVGMGSIHFSAFIKHMWHHRYMSPFYKGPKLAPSPSLMNLFCKLIAWICNHEDQLLNAYIDDFKRIDELFPEQKREFLFNINRAAMNHLGRFQYQVL